MSKRNSNKPIIPSEKIFVGYSKKSQFFEDNRNCEEKKMSSKKDSATVIIIINILF